MDKNVGDLASVALIVGALLEFLPHVAGALALIWWGMRIYQTRLEIKKLKEQNNDGSTS